MRASELFHIRKGITSVIGSGGKTTLLRSLAAELPGTVILTTTTHIFPFEEYPLFICSGTEKEFPVIRELLMSNRVICVGRRENESSDKLSAPLCSPTELIPYADYILVEADGSACLPVKAHASYEPVIPVESSLTINVVGASGIGRPISEVCHRPELFCCLTGALPENLLTPSLLASALGAEALGDLLFVNQCDLIDSALTEELSEELRKKSPVPFFFGALKPGRTATQQ